jgi:hypothetical protein
LLRTRAYDDIHSAARLHLHAGSRVLLDDVTHRHLVVRNLHLATELQSRLLEDLLRTAQSVVGDAGNLYVRGSLADRDLYGRADPGGLACVATRILPGYQVLVFRGALSGLDLDLETRFLEESLGLLARFSLDVGHVRDPGANDVHGDLRPLFGHLTCVRALRHDGANCFCALYAAAFDNLEPIASHFSRLFDGAGSGEVRDHGFRGRIRNESVGGATEQYEKEY